MSDQNTLTLCGNIGTDPRTFATARGVRGLSFRLGVTAYRMTDAGTFQSLDTRWYTVRAFDKLAENLLRSLHKGQPVIVVGRPGVNAWKDEGGEVRSELQITASHVGFDLKHGTGHFWRTPKQGESVPPASGERGEWETTPPAIDEGVEATPTAQIVGPGAYAQGEPVDPGDSVDGDDLDHDAAEVGDAVEGAPDDAVGAGNGRGVFREEYAPF